MSCLLVSQAHIDALVTSGLYVTAGPLRWLYPAPEKHPDFPAACAEGQPWGPEAKRLFDDCRRVLDPSTAGATGAMLWAENMRSVNHCYGESAVEPPYNFRLIRPLPAVVVLKAVDCYEYQSCLHPGYATSEAHAFCNALRRALITELCGYDEAPWELSEADVELIRLGRGRRQERP